jgi:hypothetical protein
VNVSVLPQDKLDSLVSNSAIWLKEIEDGHFENLEENIAQHNQSLMDYMEGKEINNLPRQQQEKLRQLLNKQKAAIKIISEKKRQLASKLTELRNGRNLKNTYKNSSL